MPSTKQLINTVSNKLIKKAKQEPDIFFSSLWKSNKHWRVSEFFCDYFQVATQRIHCGHYVALCLLDMEVGNLLTC